MSHPFREAVERRDHAAMVEELADDVEFHSPVTFRPFVGREAVSVVLGAVLEVLEDFQYTDELTDGDAVALVFRARVGDRSVEGLDLLRFDDAGKIGHFTVMVRPASAVMALAEAMGPRVQGVAKAP
jgi:hypothetical protein